MICDVRCARCNEPVETFAQWFSETCPRESELQPGHVLSWEQLMPLQLRPVAGQDQQEAKQP